MQHDPKSDKDRAIDENKTMREQDGAGTDDPSGTAQPGDDRRENARRKTGLGTGFVRRTD